MEQKAPKSPRNSQKKEKKREKRESAGRGRGENFGVKSQELEGEGMKITPKMSPWGVTPNKSQEGKNRRKMENKNFLKEIKKKKFKGKEGNKTEKK